MCAAFTFEHPTTMTLSSKVSLRIPGGMRVPADYPYVHTGDHLIDKCEAAWSDGEGDDAPLSFRLIGPPGVGKNAAVFALAARRRQPLYIVLGTEELTAEDLAVSAALLPDGSVQYVASPLLAAMLGGGICFIDEIAKMRPRALAPLSSVLDSRRSLSSALLGETFEARPSFRLCAAYNPTDVDAFDLPPWLKRRTLPELQVAAPDWSALEQIVLSSGTASRRVGRAVLAHARKIGRELDPASVGGLVAYAERIAAFAKRNKVDLGDEISVAFRHMLAEGKGADASSAGEE